VVVDDAQLVVALVGVRGEPVSGERIGNCLHGRAQAALAHRQVGAGEALGHRQAVLLAHFFRHRFGLVVRQQGQGTTEQRQHQVVAVHRHVAGEIHLGIGRHPIVLAGPPGTGALGTLDGNFQVAAGGQLVEVVAGHVGVHAELLGHLRGGDPGGFLASEQVDATTRRVAERVGDGRHGAGEGRRVRGHGDILPMRVVVIRTRRRRPAPPDHRRP